ncbi:MAG TPA: cell division protein FtsZ, partial [Bacteroidia bacterium]|nr:cell division protein FtsZ [Bacteroidia bacterium]
GSLPEVGRKSGLESIDEIKKILGNNTKMVFITAGLGGGTGTGAAPVIAQAAKEMGILTVAIVTVPFMFEGKKRKIQAEEGLKELRQHVDTILIINNDKLREMYGNLKLGEAFAHADNILNIAAKSIAEIITVTLHVNLDFADVQTVMKESGVAIMGSASAEGDNRALRAVEMALASPLLNDNNIRGARYVLLNITCGSDDITMDELGEITDYLQEAAGQTADIIKGYGIDETLGNKVNVTLIATGFSANPVTTFAEKKVEKIIRRLDDVAQTNPMVSAAPPAPRLMFNLNEEAKPAVEMKPAAEVKPMVNEAPVQEEKKTFEPFIKPTETTNEKTVEFEINNKPWENVNASVPSMMTPPPIPSSFQEPAQEERVEMSDPVFSEEQRKKAQERIEKLKQLSYKLKTPGALNEMENEPAYKRRNVELGDTPHSSESNVSRFTLSEGEGNKGELRQNNSFLHDNVD